MFRSMPSAFDSSVIPELIVIEGWRLRWPEIELFVILERAGQ